MWSELPDRTDLALKSYRKPLRAEYFFAIIANRLNTPDAYEA
jgi:hypothetical protein